MARDPINQTALGQATPAIQWAFAKAAGARGGRKSASRRKKKASARVRVRRRRSAAVASSRSRTRRPSAKRNKLVKGSAAARRHMARLRRMRRRK